MPHKSKTKSSSFPIRLSTYKSLPEHSIMVQPSLQKQDRQTAIWKCLGWRLGDWMTHWGTPCPDSTCPEHLSTFSLLLLQPLLGFGELTWLSTGRQWVRDSTALSCGSQSPSTLETTLLAIHCYNIGHPSWCFLTPKCLALLLKLPSSNMVLLQVISHVLIFSTWI